MGGAPRQRSTAGSGLAAASPQSVAAHTPKAAGGARDGPTGPRWTARANGLASDGVHWRAIGLAAPPQSVPAVADDDCGQAVADGGLVAASPQSVVGGSARTLRRRRSRAARKRKGAEEVAAAEGGGVSGGADGAGGGGADGAGGGVSGSADGADGVGADGADGGAAFSSHVEQQQPMAALGAPGSDDGPFSGPGGPSEDKWTAPKNNMRHTAGSERRPGSPQTGHRDQSPDCRVVLRDGGGGPGHLGRCDSDGGGTAAAPAPEADGNGGGGEDDRAAGAAAPASAHVPAARASVAMQLFAEAQSLIAAGSLPEAAERATRALEHIDAEIDEVAGDRRRGGRQRASRRERARLEAERARGLHAQRSFRWEMAQQGDRVGPIRTESEEEDWLESEASKTLEERWWQSQENSDCADAEVDAEVDRLLSQAEAEGRRDVADDY